MNMTSNRRLARWAAALGACAAMAGAAQAQDGKPISFVVGYPAGGTTDVLARVVASALGTRLGAPVIVVNKPGASSRIAVAEVKRAAPDGNTLLFTNASPLVIFPHIYAELAYDPQKDFVPVAVAARTDLVFSVGPSVPDSVKTLKDYVAWAKGAPDRTSYASVQGTSPHFAGQQLSSVAGLNLRIIPYKGGAQGITDLLGGHVPAAVNALGEARPYAKDGAREGSKEGSLRMLALLSAHRSSLVPKVPTAGEMGYPGLDFSGWIGVLAPAGTPQATVDKLNAAIVEVLKAPAVAAQIRDLGLEPEAVSPAEFKALVASDLQNYKKAVALTGFKATD